MADLLIRNAIFSEQEENADDNPFPITGRTTKMLSNKHFKRLLTKELISAKKNISGASAINLKKLYIQLHLNEDALAKLNSSEWHVKAQAIQELGIMEQKEYLNKIYRLTNNKNDLVRMEAQTNIVKLYGFKGLRFLDVISYQLTEWQQIALLKELSMLPPENFNKIEKWLKSKNTSVIAFALKLTRTYHRFELYDQVIECLSHENEEIRFEAIYTLEKIYNIDTADVLLERYEYETLKNQKAIVSVMQNIASDESIPMLISFLNQGDNDLKRMIVRTVAHINTSSLLQLKELQTAQEYPLEQIIKQIEGEIK
ncbi:HEAT repeat domain-containing protein [Pedobacter boryungensis]|uniref:HEAT repeat domain-containing protein n=2 Tax=Pedobacter boryungensis TaxID=869962 RepID=A0ABX2DIJ4_9SPHI|nr:HEAT repeat domain-containing protein [Pedobacter boryungensis]NQX32944.1 HEAT repeat domain-containing protein [Pedobacter boryungensis]